MPDLKVLIGYMVDQVTDIEGVVGRTSLTKLVYLVDVEHYRRHGEMATELKWRFHHYGPYADELNSALDFLGPDIEEQKFTTTVGSRPTSGYRYSRRGDWKEIHRPLNSQFGALVKRSVDKVIDRWAVDPLPTVLDYVYFETEPMQGAKRGEYLDFSKVQRDTPAPRNTAMLMFTEEFVEDMRRRLKERREQIGKETRKATEPLYDDIYAEACRVMAEEEGGSGPYFPSNGKVTGPDLE